jgi:hypothetical protein
MQRLGGLATLGQLRGHMQELRDARTLASLAAELNMASLELVGCIPATNLSAATSYKGIWATGGGPSYRTTLNVGLGSDGRPLQGSKMRGVCLVSGMSGPEAAAAWDLGMLWRGHHLPASKKASSNFSIDRSVDGCLDSSSHISRNHWSGVLISGSWTVSCYLCRHLL